MIGGNLGVSYVTNDPGTSPLMGIMGSAGNTSEFTGGSPFQKLMSQMMANGSNLRMGTLTQTDAGSVLNSGNIGETNGISQLLGEMIFGSAGQTKLNLQNAAEGIEDSTTVGDSDPDPSDLMTSSLDSILSMFGGPVNAYVIENQNSGNSEKSPIGADALKALIGSVNRNDNGVGGTMTQTNGSDQSKYGLSATGVSAHVICETTGENGMGNVLAEINGKMIEFSGYLKGFETPVNTSVDSPAATGSITESAGTMTAMEIIAMLKDNAEENSASVNLILEDSGSGGAMKTMSAQPMNSPEAYGIQQSGLAEKGMKDVTDTLKEKAESGIESIEGSLKSAYQSQIQSTIRTDAAETTQLTQQTEAPEAYSQIREEILSKLEQKGPTEFKMQLAPEDLGQIDVKLKLSEGKLVIDILAADTRTQALLTNQVDKLISSMGLQNVQVESVQVSQQMNSQTQDNNQNQGFTMNSAMDFSQKRQQDQNQQELFNNGKPTGMFNPQQDETKTNDAMNRIQSIRYNSHRMNYSV